MTLKNKSLLQFDASQKVQEKKRYELQQSIEDERLNGHEHIYTDRLLKEEQVVCAVVMPSSKLKYQLKTTIFNAEIFAI
jgi:hypothetical protein